MKHVVRAATAIAAARAGKHVFCEKPLANSLKDAERMLAAVEKAGVIHMICHNYRRAPAVQLAREAGEELSADLTKAEASEHIDRLQEKSGRAS